MKELPLDCPLVNAYVSETGSDVIPMDILAECCSAPPFDSNEKTADFLLYVLNQQLKKLRCRAMIRSMRDNERQAV